MKRMLAALATSVVIGIGAMGATAAPADAAVSLHFGLSYGYSHPYYRAYPARHWACMTVSAKRVWWWRGVRYVSYSPVNSCGWHYW